MKAAVEHHFNGPTAPLTGSYDSTKTLIASLLRQATGTNAEDNYISTKPSVMVNLPENAVGSQFMPHVYKWSNNIYWVFACSNATPAVTRTITLFEFNSDTSTINYIGYITLSGTTVTGAKTIRSFRAFVYEHTTGTVSTTGTSTIINGSGTGFQSERIAVGARIGFGTTDPTQVSTWYEITAITNDTTLTINAPVTLAPGTSYVIEEIRLTLAVTNATLLFGGVHLIKGLNYNTFTVGGTIIPEATTIDNIRSSYLLLDPISGSAASASFTATSGSTTTTLNSHGFIANELVYVTSSATLPAPLAVNTGYFIHTGSIGTNTFALSTTYNGAPIVYTTSGSAGATHVMYAGSSKVAATLGADDFVSFTDHSLYLLNGTSIAGFAASITRYNIRAPLTVGPLNIAGTAVIPNGTTVSAFIARTAPLAHTTTLSQLNCGRIATLNHGIASGSKCLYFVTTGATTQKILRAPIANITQGSTNWIADGGMSEVPPGTTTVYSALSNYQQVDYSSTIDRLFVSNGTNRFGIYIGTYNTSGVEFEKNIGANLNRVKVNSTPGGPNDGLFPQAAMTVWTEDGWMFSIPSVVTSGQNWLFIWPFAADAFYNATSNQHVITPKLATPNASKLYHVYVDHQEYAGSYGLGFPVESYKLWYRTSGIDDNSGAWTEVPVGADLTNVTPGDYIQFKIAFDIMGEICVPTRIYSICCTYEDKSQDSHYEPSLTKSSAQNRQFAWRQISSWGGTIPNLRLRLFNVANDATVLDDDITSNAYGTWEYSTDGTNWSAWNSSADTIGNYIRYTADDGIIGNLITVRALLTQA